jgi:hypothetical protein
MSDTERPAWDLAFREIGLVALQAAVLTRRILSSTRRTDELDPLRREIVMALALTDSAPYEQLEAVTVESLASQLTLGPELVRELVWDLYRSGHLAIRYDENVGAGEEPVGYSLSLRGWAAARGSCGTCTAPG